MICILFPSTLELEKLKNSELIFEKCETKDYIRNLCQWCQDNLSQKNLYDKICQNELHAWQWVCQRHVEMWQLPSIYWQHEPCAMVPLLCGAEKGQGHEWWLGSGQVSPWCDDDKKQIEHTNMMTFLLRWGCLCPAQGRPLLPPGLLCCCCPRWPEPIVLCDNWMPS